MMHNRAGRKLRRTTPHRLAMFSNQLQSLMTHERIQTTLTKAKELRPLAERLITIGKNDGMAARRQGGAMDPGPDDRQEGLRDDLRPRFVDRPGGYTRILRLGSRKGDAAEAAILEFVDYKFEAKEKAPRTESLSDRARRASGGRVETVRKEKPEDAEAAPEAPKPPKKARPTRGDAGRAAAEGRPQEGPEPHGAHEERRVATNRINGVIGSSGDRRAPSMNRWTDDPIARSARLARARRAALLWGLFLLALTSWPSPPTVPVLSGIPSIDKVVHALLYGVEGGLLLRAIAWPGLPGPTLGRALCVVGALAVFGTADETHQAFIPGRSMEGRDALMDTAGAAIGTAAAWVGRRRRDSRAERLRREARDPSLRSG